MNIDKTITNIPTIKPNKEDETSKVSLLVKERIAVSVKTKASSAKTKLISLMFLKEWPRPFKRINPLIATPISIKETKTIIKAIDVS